MNPPAAGADAAATPVLWDELPKVKPPAAGADAAAAPVLCEELPKVNPPVAGGADAGAVAVSVAGAEAAPDDDDLAVFAGGLDPAASAKAAPMMD